MRDPYVVDTSVGFCKKINQTKIKKTVDIWRQNLICLWVGISKRMSINLFQDAQVLFENISENPQTVKNVKVDWHS